MRNDELDYRLHPAYVLVAVDRRRHSERYLIRGAMKPEEETSWERIAEDGAPAAAPTHHHAASICTDCEYLVERA